MNYQTTDSGEIRKRQAVLKAGYLSHPDTAIVVDYACTNSETVNANHALHSQVMLDKHNPTTVPVGVHTALGGDSDQPTPGDILCGAVAACFDSTLRIIANGMGVNLTSLAVTVTGRVDVRGTLLLDKDVPVAFQTFNIAVSLEGQTPIPERQKAMLLAATERSCVVMQTLKGNPNVDVVLQLVSLAC